jgi:hypothetical protein
LLDHVEPILQGRAPRQAKPWGDKLRRLQGDFRATNLYRIMLGARDGSHLPSEFDFVNTLAWVLLGVFLLWLWW